MSTKLSPFYTDQKTADAIVAAAKKHLAQPTDGQAVGVQATGVTSQFQNTCQFKLITDWKEISASNFAVSGKKIVPLHIGAEKRTYPITIYAYGERPTMGKDSMVVATRRANRWVLLPAGTAGEVSASIPKVRLVQPKELFPACEYKTLQDVYGCTLEYSDDGEAWIPAYTMNIVGGRYISHCPAPDPSFTPHKYWRVNLKGFSKPEDPNDPYADRGFYTFGRLWEALFWVKRTVETTKTVNGTEYTLTANVPDHWRVNQTDVLPVELTLSPSVSNDTLFYKPNTGDWESLGTFSGSKSVMIPADDLRDGSSETATSSFQFKIEANGEEVGNLTLQRPTYKLLPERPSSFSLPERPVTAQGNGCTMTAKVTSLWKASGGEQVSVDITLDPPVVSGILHYRCKTGLWQELGDIHQNKTVSVPAEDLQETQNTFFEFAVTQNGIDIVGVTVPRPAYPMTSDAAEAAMPPARLDIETAHMFWDSKPTPRKSGTPKYWMLTFDQPEVVTHVTLDIDQHCEHYIICPGGRDANKRETSFIYSFDLAAEKWTALTFPEMNYPMFNMDAKVVELVDGTHQLVILSGQIAKGFSNVIQGYNFEGDVIQEVRNLGEGAINFAGRPALTGDPMVRWVNTSVQYPDGENDFSRSLMVVGGSEQSCRLETASTSVLDSVLFSVQGSTLKVGNPYRIQTQNMSMSNVGYTGLPYGAFDYKTYTSQAGSVGTKLSNMAKYTRHQNLPVRGILRRRPAGNTSAPSSNNTIVDFLLLGGFNSVGNEEHNKSVVSGAFIAMTWSASGGRTQMLYPLAINPLTLDWDSMCDRLLYFPDVLRNGEPYILGDCCAEYVEERDEVLCFGGRARATDTASAHAPIAVLDFKQTTPGMVGYQDKQLEGKWLYQKYPDMPHPRWSAASVLIKGLLRNGETEPCDRIFIIGGRNSNGFVPEVDVFNLRYNQWETDWKGLDQGELETASERTAGGGTTIIVQGGGDGVQSIKAGEGISVSSDKKNPVVSINIQAVVNKILQDETFISSIVSSPLFVEYVTQQISEIVYAPEFVTNILNSETFQQFFTEQFLEIINDETYIHTIINQVVHNETLHQTISNTIVNNTEFIDAMTNYVTAVISHDETYINNIINQVVNNSVLYETISNILVNTGNFIENVTNQFMEIICGDEYFGDFVTQVIEHIDMTEISNLLIQDGNFIQTIAKQVITLIDLDTLLQSITELIAAGAITLVDPDGNSIAISDGNGRLTIQAATKERYGIVKLQDGSGGQGGTPLDKMVAAPDRSVIGIIENRDLVVQQTTPAQFGVVKCRPDCPCYRKLSLQSMDGRLTAVLKSGKHLFYPMTFPQTLPPKVELYDKLTFIANETGNTCCCEQE